MNKNRTIVILVTALALVGVLWGVLGRESAEERAERAIERATNSSADVELDDRTVTINANGGSLQVGESVDLPDGFPSDVHVIEGTRTSATTVTENRGYSMTVNTPKSVEAATAEYESEMAGDGWTNEATLTVGGTTSLRYVKGTRTATISVTSSDGETTVIIVTSDPGA